MKAYRKLQLSPEQIMTLMGFSQDVMEKCGDLLDYDGPMSERTNQDRSADLARLKLSEEYQRLLKYILNLRPEAMRELRALVDVAEKKHSTADFVKACDIVNEKENTLVQATYLMDRTLLYKSIPRGIDALVRDKVIKEEG